MSKLVAIPVNPEPSPWKEPLNEPERIDVPPVEVITDVPNPNVVPL